MRRPLVPILLIQCLIVVILIKAFGMEFYHTDFCNSYGSVVKISGVVSMVRENEYYTQITLDAGSENVLVKLTGDIGNVYDLVGRELTVTGKITEPNSRRNPGGFDYAMYLRARRCYSIMNVSQFKTEIGEIRRPAMHYLSIQKGAFLDALREMLGSDYSLVYGVVFGDKSYLDDELYEQFQNNGIAHVLAVSGLHVGLVYKLVRKLLKRNDIIASLVSIGLLFVYAALADFSVSVIRAGAMILLSVIALHLRRRYDMLSAACAVAIVIVSVNPYYLFDSGAQLSFLAAYSLAVLLPWFENKYYLFCDKHRSEKLKKLGEIFLPGIVLQIGMVPLLAYHFLSFSLLSIFINPIAIYLASLLLPAGLFCFVFHPFKILLAAGCGVCKGICFALSSLSNFADALMGGFDVPAPSFTLIALYYILIFYLFSETKTLLVRSGKAALSNFLILALTASSLLLPYTCGISQSILPWKYNRYDAVFLDVGQGDSIHIYSKGVNVLIDGGGSYYTDVAKNTLKPYLLKNGITSIDLAVVTHLDSDHSKGIADLSQDYKIKQIVFPEYARGEDLSDFNCDNKVFLSKGSSFIAGEAKFTVLSKCTGSDANEASMAMLCEINGTKILLMSDLPKESELSIEFTDVDILKLGHHGSKTSTSDYLIETARPEIAIASCGLDNRYGHPHSSVLELLENSGIILHRTDFEGAILCKDGKVIEEWQR